MSAILNVQNDSFPGVCANGNIDFWILHALKIPKIYSITNPPKMSMNKHNEPDYMFKSPFFYSSMLGYFLNCEFDALLRDSKASHFSDVAY